MEMRAVAELVHKHKQRLIVMPSIPGMVISIRIAREDIGRAFASIPYYVSQGINTAKRPADVPGASFATGKSRADRPRIVTS